MEKSITQDEAFKIMRDDLKRHNDTAHPEDQFYFVEWLDECVGNTYGNWKAVRSIVNTSKVILVKNN